MITTGITAQKKARASLGQNENAEPSVRIPTGEGNLSQIDRAEMQECLL
jgi:hypothetical protein